MSRQAKLSACITVETKKATLHHQPYSMDKPLAVPSPSITPDERYRLGPNEMSTGGDTIDMQYRLPPPAQNREMLSRIYNACNRKLKKPKLKVKQANENNLEVVNEPTQIHNSIESAKSSKVNLFILISHLTM